MHVTNNETPSGRRYCPLKMISSLEVILIFNNFWIETVVSRRVLLKLPVPLNSRSLLKHGHVVLPTETSTGLGTVFRTVYVARIDD